MLEIEKSFSLKYAYLHDMMLGSKDILPPTDAYELLRCKAAHTILHNNFLLINFFGKSNLISAEEIFVKKNLAPMKKYLS